MENVLTSNRALAARKKVLFMLLTAVAVMFSSCIISVDSSDNKPDEDYAPRQMGNGAYITFTHTDGSYMKIVFSLNNNADLTYSTASKGKITAGNYKYEGYNEATLIYNYQPNGGYATQYTAELDFTRSDGGKITFHDKSTGSFTYRP